MFKIIDYLLNIVATGSAENKGFYNKRQDGTRLKQSNI